MDIQYHNECEECGDLFWTADGFNTICFVCRWGDSRLLNTEERLLDTYYKVVSSWFKKQFKKIVL